MKPLEMLKANKPVVTYVEHEGILTIFVRNHSFIYATGEKAYPQGMLETHLTRELHDIIVREVAEGETEKTYVDTHTGLTVNIRVVCETVHMELQKNYVRVPVELPKSLLDGCTTEVEYRKESGV